MMMVFLPINNNTKLSYIAIIVMLVSNTLMDILSVVLNLGAFGLGLATSISYIIVFMLAFPSFMDKYKAIHFEWGNFCFSRLYEAAMLGLPSLMFTVGCTVKGYIMNMTLIHNIGSSAVAVMNVQGNICSTIGAVPLGCANAFLALSSLYYGEEDRKSLLYLTKYSLNAGIILSSVAMILIMSLSYYISDIFFNVNDEAFAISMRMLLLFPGFLVFNAIFSIFIKAYQLQGQTRLINILSLGENILMAALAVVFVPIIGSDAVWLAFPISDILCILCITLSVFVFAYKITFSLPDWLKLSSSFGADESQLIEFTITSMDQVINISQKIICFCSAHGISRRKSNIAGLTVEEMAGNVVRHGFRQGRNNSISLRIVSKDILTIRLRDNCPEFDPKKRLEQFSGEDPCANLGIKLTARLADEMIYQNIAGLNTVMIKINTKE